LTFRDNFANYVRRNKDNSNAMFYDFTIRTRDNGAIPANKAMN
jgi:hypothetical protein